MRRKGSIQVRMTGLIWSTIQLPNMEPMKVVAIMVFMELRDTIFFRMKY